MARVTWTAQALGDIEALYTFLARDAASYGELLVEALLDAGATLGDAPDAGTPVPAAENDEVRALAHGPWRLLYHVVPDEVQILALVPGCD